MERCGAQRDVLVLMLCGDAARVGAQGSRRRCGVNQDGLDGTNRVTHCYTGARESPALPRTGRI